MLHPKDGSREISVVCVAPRGQRRLSNFVVNFGVPIGEKHPLTKRETSEDALSVDCSSERVASFINDIRHGVGDGNDFFELDTVSGPLKRAINTQHIVSGVAGAFSAACAPGKIRPVEDFLAIRL